MLRDVDGQREECWCRNHTCFPKWQSQWEGGHRRLFWKASVLSQYSRTLSSASANLMSCGTSCTPIDIVAMVESKPAGATHGEEREDRGLAQSTCSGDQGRRPRQDWHSKKKQGRGQAYGKQGMAHVAPPPGAATEKPTNCSLVHAQAVGKTTHRVCTSGSCREWKLKPLGLETVQIRVCSRGLSSTVV